MCVDLRKHVHDQKENLKKRPMSHVTEKTDYSTDWRKRLDDLYGTNFAGREKIGSDETLEDKRKRIIAEITKNKGPLSEKVRPLDPFSPAP